MNFATMWRWALIKAARDWGKRNLPPNLWRRIDSSYTKVLVVTIVLCLVFIGVVIFPIIGISSVGSSNMMYRENTRTGHYEDGKVWYVYNDKHYVDASSIGAYGYENGDKFDVIVDSDGNAIGIADGEGDISGYFVSVLVISIVFIIVVIVSIPVGNVTYGRAWRRYFIWYVGGCHGRLDL